MSFFQSLIPFLSLFYNCQLNSVPLLPNSYAGRLAPRTSTLLHSTELFFITTLHGPRRKHNVSVVGKACLQRRCIVTEVIRLLLACSLPRQCLPSHCKAMNVYSSFRASCHTRKSMFCSWVRNWQGTFLSADVRYTNVQESNIGFHVVRLVQRNIATGNYLPGWYYIFLHLVICNIYIYIPPLWSSGRSFWLQIQRSGFDSRRYQIFSEK
jgi:hypothetical protein